MSRDKPRITNTHVGILIEEFTTSIDASISYEVRDLRYSPPDTRVFSFDSAIKIHGQCLCPEESLERRYSVSILARKSGLVNFDLTLKDCHLQDSHGSYR